MPVPAQSITKRDNGGAVKGWARTQNRRFRSVGSPCWLHYLGPFSTGTLYQSSSGGVIIARRCGLVLKGWEPRVFLLILLLFLIPRFPLSPQERPDSVGVTLVGQVVDRATGPPIENAVFRVPELGVHLLSDSTGQFQLRGTRPGVYRMKITCLGYREEEGDFTVFQQGSFRVALSPIVLGPDAEPGRIVGRVSAPETGDPIRDAEVSLVDMGLLRTTNRSGWFEFPEIPPGIHLLRVSILGRETREDSVFLDDNQLLEINVRLAIEPIPLEGITVTAYPRWLMASGFFRRRGRGYEGRQ